MMLFILLVFVPNYCKGWNFISGYPYSMYDTVGVLEEEKPDSCVTSCLTKYYKSHLDFIVVTTSLDERSHCYCGKHAPVRIGEHKDWVHLPLWRPPVNFNHTSLQIGNYYKAYVYISEFVAGNDSFEIYVTKSLQNPTKESGSIIIDLWENLPDSSLNEDGPRYLQRSEITKKEGSIMETFPTLTDLIQPHYTFTFMVTDTGVTDSETNWFVSLFTNNKIIVVDLMAYKYCGQKRTVKLKLSLHRNCMMISMLKTLSCYL